MFTRLMRKLIRIGVKRCGHCDDGGGGGVGHCY